MWTMENDCLAKLIPLRSIGYCLLNDCNINCHTLFHTWFIVRPVVNIDVTYADYSLQIHSPLSCFPIIFWYYTLTTTCSSILVPSVHCIFTFPILLAFPSVVFKHRLPQCYVFWYNMSKEVFFKTVKRDYLCFVLKNIHWKTLFLFLALVEHFLLCKLNGTCIHDNNYQQLCFCIC